MKRVRSITCRPECSRGLHHHAAARPSWWMGHFARRMVRRQLGWFYRDTMARSSLLRTSICSIVTTHRRRRSMLLRSVLVLARQHTELPVMVQFDSLSAISCLFSSSLDRSVYGHLVAEIKSLVIYRVFIPQKLHWSQNSVADCLARYSRSERAIAVWLDRGPPCIEELLLLDCSPTFLE